MRERLEPVLKIVCLALAALLLGLLSRVALRPDPLGQVRAPEVPVLVVKTNAPPGAHAPQPPAAMAAVRKETNLVAKSVGPASGTNAISSQAGAKGGTNAQDGALAVKTGTNAAPTRETAKGSAPPPARTRPPRGMGGPGPGMMGPELPPLVKTRVDRIIESEILGPVFHPMPMALLGIAGETAFLRSPNGQTGLMKQGEEMGGIKLLRIGPNRVLVEDAGEKKELTVFSGMGGETLLPKSNDNPK